MDYQGTNLANRRFLEKDNLGSIILIANNSGSTVATNRYDEYGVPQTGNAGRFQYTGQIWLSELGLCHYKARLYSPALGRFLQTDPVGDKDQTNLYAYVGDDPVNANDPTGLSCDPGTGQNCKADSVDKGVTKAQVNRVVGAVQKAVNTLLKDPSKSATLRTAPTIGTRIPMTQRTTQGEMANAIIAATLTIHDAQPTDDQGNERNWRASGGGELGKTQTALDIYPHFFQAPNPKIIIRKSNAIRDQSYTKAVIWPLGEIASVRLMKQHTEEGLSKMITMSHSRRWRGTFIFPARGIALCYCAIACSPVSPAPGASNSSNDWSLWFAEYAVTDPQRYPTDQVLTVLPGRFVTSKFSDSIHDRASYPGDRSLDIYGYKKTYLANSLPVFAPTLSITSVRGVEFDCSSVKNLENYTVTCVSKYSKDVFKSEFDPLTRVNWFEYYCGYPKTICKFVYARGAKLLDPQILRMLDQRGETKALPESR